MSHYSLQTAYKNLFQIHFRITQRQQVNSSYLDIKEMFKVVHDMANLTKESGDERSSEKEYLDAQMIIQAEKAEFRAKEELENGKEYLL